MVNAYQPKVSLLEKLAELIHDLQDRGHNYLSALNDQEVLEWYDRMAELNHVPARRGVPAIHNAALTFALDDGVRFKAEEKIVDTMYPRQGYQIFATKSVDHEAEDVCSYTEATSVNEAMQRCLEQFAGDEYFNHGVKNIETQVVTEPKPSTALSLD